MSSLTREQRAALAATIKSTLATCDSAPTEGDRLRERRAVWAVASDLALTVSNLSGRTRNGNRKFQYAEWMAACGFDPPGLPGDA